MNTIVFFDTAKDEKNFFEEACEGKYKTIFTSHSLNKEFYITDEIKNAEAISCFTVSILGKEVLEKFPNLRLIALRCVGYNNIDIEYCKKKNITIVNAKGYGNRTVAEFALGLIIDVSRNISSSYIDIQKDEENKNDYTGFELINKTLGVIGVGAIGAELVKIGRGLGMEVLGYDLYEKDELKRDYSLEYTTLDDLLKRSDFISLHAPLTDDNFHLIDEEKISLMKETAIIVNTARGELIKTEALYKALSFNTIKGAGLDVLEYEEATSDFDMLFDMDYIDKKFVKQILLKHEISKLENVVITPHIAYDTIEAKNRIRTITMDNINSFFSGKIKNSIY